MRKPLKQEVSPSEMLYLRESEGLSNKQIAQRIGCSVSSVYAFIGKRSRSVANALAQNKPLPVPESVVTGRYEEPVRKEENPMMEQKKSRERGTFRFHVQFLRPNPDHSEGTANH